MHKTQQAAFGPAHRHDGAAVGRVIHRGRCDELSALSDNVAGNRGEIADVGHAKRDRAQLGSRGPVQREHMMIAAAGAQIHRAVMARDHGEPPHRDIELFGAIEIRGAEIDAAERGDRKAGHVCGSSCRDARPPSAGRSRPVSPVYYIKSSLKYKFINFMVLEESV